MAARKIHIFAPQGSSRGTTLLGSRGIAAQGNRNVTFLNKAYILSLVALLTAAPLSFAHEGMTGQPKHYCETPFAHTAVHEYGAPGTGSVIFIGSDWSLPPCPYGDTTWDGHLEFAFGGAWLQARDSDCTTAYADHAPGSTIKVYDAVLSAVGSDVAFSVYADTLNNDPIPSEPNCGDFESDYGVDCVNECAPGFPPGLDGTYQVYVSGTTGHIYNGPPPPGLPVCSDGQDNDGDGLIDYPLDSGCTSSDDTNEATTTPCSDGIDNDGDGWTDYPLDPGCSSRADTNEGDEPQCSDRRDNDGDGWIDFPLDPGCENSGDGSENTHVPQCSDRVNNDPAQDDLPDYPLDPQCESAADDDESQ